VSYLDTKYINLISNRLERFSWKTGNLATCRCPICGDSKKNKSKKRFYFFQEKGIYFVKCHNCSYTTAFSKFLERTDGNLYREYLFESFGDRKPKQEEVTYVPSDSLDRLRDNPLIGLSSISDLPDKHYAKSYVRSRRIPERYWNDLYFTEDFKEFAKKIDEDKDNLRNEPRLIIPFFDEDRNLIAAQGRSLNPKDYLRYITVRNKSYLGCKYYGIDRLDASKTVYVTEGPIDSLFLDNAIAIAGSTVNEMLPCSKDKVIFVYDNEPRNREIVCKIEDTINLGYRVCIWPDYLDEKDINDMVLNGKNPQYIIDQNVYSGLLANLKLKEWSKV